MVVEKKVEEKIEAPSNSLLYQPSQENRLRIIQQQREEKEFEDYFEKALQRVNCLIFGMYSSQKASNRSKVDTVNLEMTNCFIKVCGNGRDVFFERVNFELRRIDKKNAPL